MLPQYFRPIIEIFFLGGTKTYPKVKLNLESGRSFLGSVNQEIVLCSTVKHFMARMVMNRNTSGDESSQRAGLAKMQESLKGPGTCHLRPGVI